MTHEFLHCAAWLMLLGALTNTRQLFAQSEKPAPPAHAQQPVQPPKQQPLPPGQRRIVHHEWVGQWMRGGKREEALFGQPREMVASNDGVYVADGGALELFAFAPTGNTRWRIGRKGGGPGEFQQMDDVTLDAQGNVILLDPNNARITRISAAGKLMRTVTTGAVPWTNGVCALGSGHFAVLTSSADAYVTVLDTAGKVVRAVTFPWPLPGDAPSFVRNGYFARGATAGDCWLATTFGFGIARVGSSVPARTSPFVENVLPPKIRVVATTAKQTGGQFVDRGDNAALAAFTHGDTLFVHFMGKADVTKPLLDLYDSSGRYLESWNLPEHVERIAYANGVLYTIENSLEAAALIAWKSSGGANTKKPAATKRAKAPERRQ